ncbi:hyaluronidase-3 isoform X1 [Salarias fasciatus]|uniref:Hyaluronidase n=1 Tax=Salarias fasciatus TaxID=181472 RepID=A0A672H2Z5_SALFA|nr:hyaluronidase-3-like isoform X1 [Salarias fasciatus]XP_029974371.1 hyaluronidase-3-like isoform X1 [Salarias fasciatus]
MALSRLPLRISVLLLVSSLPHSEPVLRSDAGPPVAAAGPLLQDRPFVVVWNMPTARCQGRYGVRLDLADFDIVENREQRFLGQKVTIFYRDRLGMYPYLSRGGRKVNGGVPQLGDLDAHLALAATQLSASLRSDFTGMAVIDWEEWRPLWERNFGSKMKYRRFSKLLVRRTRPDLPEEAVATVARKQFEESAQRFMEETLRSAVGDRPKGLWGFYGLPNCFNMHKRKTDKTYTGRCHRRTREQNDRLSRLWTQSTALYPSIYLPQRLAGSPDAALMIRHRLLEALRVASLWRRDDSHATPVLPYARLAFTHTLNFLNKTDLEHTLGESAALGAAGVVLWGEVKFAKSEKQCILLRDYIHSVLGPYVQSLRSDTRRCSLQLCRGNGRCVGRRSSSGRSFSSVFGGRDGEMNVSAQRYTCQCYPGWTGLKCEESEKP